MKKTVIALAVAAAMPVAAQADVALTASVAAKLTAGTAALDVDSDLDISSTEVLANGMTATASFDVGSEGDSGKLGLSGDFGALTIGSALDSDGAFQAGDVAGVIADTTVTADTASTTNAIHYSGDFASLAVAAQLNAATDATGTATETKSTQLSVTYNFNGLNMGYAYASDDADADDTTGVNAAQNLVGATYSFGDLVVSAGKSSIVNDVTISGTYTATVDNLSVAATVKSTGAANSHKLVLGYDLNGMALNITEDSAKSHTAASAVFTSGDLTVTAARVNDGSNDLTAALAMGNAALTVKRDGSATATTATYKVSF